MKLSALTPDKKNANKGTDRGRQLIQESLKSYGAGRSILLDRHGNIIAGNKTAEGAAAVGLDDVIIVKSDGKKLIAVQRIDLDIDSKAARELAIADNRTAELNLEWDPEVLKSLNFALPQFWNEAERMKLFALLEPEKHSNEELAAIEEEKLAEAQKKWKVKAGQLWMLDGSQRHRLFCGDAKEKASVEKLFGAERPELLFTSPPYSDQRDYRSGFNWDELMCRMWDAWTPQLSDESSLIVNLGMAFKDRAVEMYWDAWLKHSAMLGLPLFGWYVWDKVTARPGDYMGRLPLVHEFLFHFRKGRVRARKMVASKHYGSKNCKTHGMRQSDGSIRNPNSPDKFLQEFKLQDSIFRVRSATALTGDTGFGHPAPFSKALVEEIVRTFVAEGALVCDPLSGSGTTILGCEEIGRRCFACELSPLYVAITLDRLASCGLKPKLAE